jgi:hypothetical protein
MVEYELPLKEVLRQARFESLMSREDGQSLQESMVAQTEEFGGKQNFS